MPPTWRVSVCVSSDELEDRDVVVGDNENGNLDKDDGRCARVAGNAVLLRKGSELYPVQKFEFHRAYYRKAFHQHASGLFPAPVDLSMSSAHPPAADDEDLTPDCPQTAKFFEETTAPLISGLLSGESCTIFQVGSVRARMLCPSLVAEFCRRLVDAVESWNMSGNRGKRKIAVSIITVNDDDGSVYDELAEVRKKLPSSNIDDYLTREYLGIGMSAPGPLFPEVLAPVSEQNIGPPEYGTHRVVTFYVEHRSPSEQSAPVAG